MLKTACFALTLTLLPGLALAEGCSHSNTTAMSCSEGAVPDAQTGTCVPVTTS